MIEKYANKLFHTKKVLIGDYVESINLLVKSKRKVEMSYIKKTLDTIGGFDDDTLCDVILTLPGTTDDPGRLKRDLEEYLCTVTTPKVRSAVKEAIISLE